MLENKNWIKFMVGVAIACTAPERPTGPLYIEEAAAFIRDVLHITLNDRDVSVEPISYPVTTKVPLQICVANRQPRLFWYYLDPGMSDDGLCDQLADLIMELDAESTALATA